MSGADAIGQVERFAVALEQRPGFFVAALFFAMFVELARRHLKLHREHAAKVEQMHAERLRAAMEQNGVINALLELHDSIAALALDARSREKRRTSVKATARAEPTGAPAAAAAGTQPQLEPATHRKREGNTG